MYWHSNAFFSTYFCVLNNCKLNCVVFALGFFSIQDTLESLLPVIQLDFFSFNQNETIYVQHGIPTLILV